MAGGPGEVKEVGKDGREAEGEAGGSRNAQDAGLAGHGGRLAVRIGAEEDWDDKAGTANTARSPRPDSIRHPFPALPAWNESKCDFLLPF